MTTRRIQHFILLSLSAIFAIASVLVKTEAAGGQYFGGMHTASFNCTCSGSTLLYINNYSQAGSSTLALIYNGSARIYSNNNVYGTYLLGSYSSGGQCMYIVGEDCVEMQSDGMLDSNPGTGTSY